MFTRWTVLAAAVLGGAVGLVAGCRLPDAARVTFHPIGDDIRIPVDSAADLVAPMQFATESGVRCLRTPKPPKTPGPTSQAAETGGRATFHVDIPRAGVYTLYGHVFWPAEGGDGFNSFWVKVDNRLYERFGNDGKLGEWIDWKGPSWDLAAGRHTLTVRERESGACAADWSLSPVPDYVSRATTFENSRFTCTQPALLAHPPFELRGDAGRFRVFYAKPGPADVRTAGEPLPMTVRGPGARTIYAGTVPLGQEAEVALPKPSAGDYVVEVAGQQVRWQWLRPRLEKLETRSAELRSRKNTSDSFRYWWPTLVLRHQNIVRGYARQHLAVTYQPSLSYVLNEFDRAEQIADALERENYGRLDQPGRDERAFYSDADGELCPYMIHLPQGYFQSKAALPLVLFLHGSNGTQWEITRAFEARNWKTEDLRWPVIVPFARGNRDYAGPAEKDLIQMIRQLLSRYRFDEKRLVITGFSMGGGGTWRLVGDYPDMFEAAIPIGGGMPQHWYGAREKPQDLPKNLRTRVIIIHSPEDTSVPLALAEKAKQHLTERGIPFKFIAYPGGHTLYPDFIDLINGLYP